jgi:hypothetical protein
MGRSAARAASLHGRPGNLLQPSEATLKTEFFESDPFSPRKAGLLLSLDTDYRFEKGDEVTIETGGRVTKVRVLDVRVAVRSGVLSREILALKL